MPIDVGALGVRRYPTSGPRAANVNFCTEWRQKQEQFDVCQCLL